MFYRLERTIDPCYEMGYTYYTKYLAQQYQLDKANYDKCLNWDTKVGNPLQVLECPIAWKFMNKNVPVTWKHPRPAHWRDPYLRDVTREYGLKGEHNHLIFGVRTLEQLDIWFPPSIRQIMIDEFGFGIRMCTATKMWHGLRQSMLDVRTVTRKWK